MQDDGGNTYYMNEDTGETSWAKPPPPTASAVMAATNGDIIPAECTWVEMEEGGAVYYYNQETGESRWELPEDEIVQFIGESESLGDELEKVNDKDWIAEAKLAFETPGEVLRHLAIKNASIIWYGSDRPNELVRINVLEAENPYRQLYTFEEADFVTWRPKLSFYAFKSEFANTHQYQVEASENPLRTRVAIGNHKNRRDVSTWRQAPCDFWAFMFITQGATKLHVDWTSTPDRYVITDDARPRWTWTRCFSFYAYLATKYHILEADNPLRYRVASGHELALEQGWRCLCSFYAFDTQMPGTNKYYVEEKLEPHYRIKVSLEPSPLRGWVTVHTFYAFDVPMPATSKFTVQYTIPSTNPTVHWPEQYRVYLHDPWGDWANKFDFFAFAAPNPGGCF